MLAAVPTHLPAGPRRREPLYLLGGLLSSAALGLAVFGIVRTGEAGWGSVETLGVLGGAVALLVAFVAYQGRAKQPLVPLRIFRIGNLSAANATMLLLGAAWIPLWFFLNLYLQQVLGYGAFAAGAALLPMTGLILLLMVGVTARVIGRHGLKTPLVAGLLILAAGTALFGLIRSDGGFVPDVLFASLIAATGMALAYIPALQSGLSAVEPQESGLASGLLGTSYQVGSALGLAVITSIAAGFGADRLGNVAELTNGFQAAFLVAAGVAAVGALVALAFLRTPKAEPAAEIDEPAEAEPDHMSVIAA